jgi:hypothetical protein
VTTDLDGLTAVAMVWLDELDSAVMVPVVVPIHKRVHPQAGGLIALEWPPGVVRSVFGSAEQGFGVGVVARAG